MSPETAKFQYASDQSLMVYLGDSIDLRTHHRVLKLLRLLEARPIPGVRNLHPAYCSMLIVFDPVVQEHKVIEKIVRRYLNELGNIVLPSPPTIEIPVRYGDPYGPDLAELADLHGISPERVVELHSGAQYVVYFVGFVPGFAYLGGLPSELATPRLASPRKQVPAGSVAIGGDQTGVYPIETPGGWRIIGATPAPIFDRRDPRMSRLSIGDQVRFKPVSKDQFFAMQRPF